MPDLSNLQLNANPEDIGEVLPPEAYPDASEYPPPPPEGIYTFQMGKPEFESTEGKFLSAIITHRYVGGEFDGKELRFDRVSTRPNPIRPGTNSLIDQLRALGDKNHYSPRDYPSVGAYFQALADALASKEGATWKGQTRWDAYCKPCADSLDSTLSRKDKAKLTTIKGMGKFPELGNGKRNHVTKCPKGEHEVQARDTVSRRIVG